MADGEAARLAAALAAGTAEEREAAYANIETAATLSGGAQGEAVALVVACVKPLIVSVLLAPAAKIGQEEWTRASLLLYTMSKVNQCRDMVAVVAEANRNDENGFPLYLNTWTSKTNILAVVLAKDASEW